MQLQFKNIDGCTIAFNEITGADTANGIQLRFEGGSGHTDDLTKNQTVDLSKEFCTRIAAAIELVRLERGRVETVSIALHKGYLRINLERRWRKGCLLIYTSICDSQVYEGAFVARLKELQELSFLLDMRPF
jgi:hypothetical protein